MKYFGKSWNSNFCVESEQVATPVGTPCNHCEEPFEAGDQGVFYANGPAAHLNCFLRGITGSLAHVERRCGCYVPGADETDPPGMTRREAADVAVAAWEKLGGKDGNN